MNTPQLPLLAANVPTPVQLRAELEDLVERELLGPRRGPDEEIVDGGAQDAYLVGMLAPRNRRLKAGEMDSLADNDVGTVEDGNSDDVSIPTDSLAPSSIGLSCTVAADTKTLLVTVSWGRYKREKSETLKSDHGNPLTVWKRYPMGGKALTIALADGTICIERELDRTRDEPEPRIGRTDSRRRRTRPRRRHD